MSKISQDSISNIGYLYEGIQLQDHNSLNEESEYYDEEIVEIVEDIISTISVSMIFEGYSASGVISFLSNISEDDLIEKYLNFDETTLSESLVSEEYIDEQLEILNYCLSELNLGKLITRVGAGAKGLLTRAATKPLRSRAANIVSKAKDPEVARQRLQTLATKEAQKAKIAGAPAGPAGGKLSARQSAELLTRAKLSQAAQKVKGVGQKLLPIAKNIAIAGGSAYLGAKLAGAGSGTDPRTKEVERPTIGNPPAAPAAPGSTYDSSGGGGRGYSGSGGGRGSVSSSGGGTSSSKYKDLIKQGKTKEAEDLGMKIWAQKYKNTLAQKVKPGQAGYDVISQVLNKSGQTPSVTGADTFKNLTPSNIQAFTAPSSSSTPSVTGADTFKNLTPSNIQAFTTDTESGKKKKDKENASTTSESYEPYDIILEYLIGNGHADTLDEANYIMLEMDETSIQTIMNEYDDYMLAEEISDWVDNLLNEGYDLSEYTWDDIVEYYVNEAKVDTGKTDAEKREARTDRGNSPFLNRGIKKGRGRKLLDEPGKGRYFTMQHDKKQAQNERDSNEQRRRNRGAMSRGTWDNG